MAKHVTPSIAETAFNCPHCGALTTQTWFACRSAPLATAKPGTYSSNGPQLQGTASPYNSQLVNNLHLSRCFNCKKLAIWLGMDMLYPQVGDGPDPNPDLPDDIRKDYEEASSILNLSPRGAAALLRLCIQKLCVHLGQPGKNLNSDIKALVEMGLDARVQQALDYVRVVGNNAVHPGEIDVDERATAETLFKLVNVIAEKLISEPKHLDEIYGNLPPGVLEAIDKRDGRAKEKIVSAAPPE